MTVVPNVIRRDLDDALLCGDLMFVPSVDVRLEGADEARQEPSRFTSTLEEVRAVAGTIAGQAALALVFSVGIGFVLLHERPDSNRIAATAALDEPVTTASFSVPLRPTLPGSE